MHVRTECSTPIMHWETELAEILGLFLNLQLPEMSSTLSSFPTQRRPAFLIRLIEGFYVVCFAHYYWWWWEFPCCKWLIFTGTRKWLMVSRSNVKHCLCLYFFFFEKKPLLSLSLWSNEMVFLKTTMSKWRLLVCDLCKLQTLWLLFLGKYLSLLHFFFYEHITTYSPAVSTRILLVVYFSFRSLY